MSLGGKGLLCLFAQPVDYCIAGAFIGQKLAQAIALGGGYLGVGSDVEVQAARVGGKDIGRGMLLDDGPKKHARHFIGAQGAFSRARAGG